MKGYVQVYTGHGKGKTTASLGLSLRAAGAGMHVYIAQFLKQGAYSEIKALERFDDLIKVEQFGLGRFITGKPYEKDIEATKKGFEKVRAVMASNKYDLIIMEEANLAVHFKLVPIEELLDIIDKKPEELELVITGRHADPKLIEKADLVTEMKKVKHYYDKGVEARVGIEK